MPAMMEIYVWWARTTGTSKWSASESDFSCCFQILYSFLFDGVMYVSTIEGSGTAEGRTDHLCLPIFTHQSNLLLPIIIQLSLMINEQLQHEREAKTHTHTHINTYTVNL